MKIKITYFGSVFQCKQATLPQHCLSQNPKKRNKKLDCQNLRKLGEICCSTDYNFSANYYYFDKRNVIYCIFNGVTFDSYNIPNLSKIVILCFSPLCSFWQNCIINSEIIRDQGRKKPSNRILSVSPT